ncbi:MAG: phosphoribosylanthranilate isomerase [Fulvivirga sp.]|uniref:phosphoribosylanthranilate isomerase n=1 Tax=Fulvivirga sp. TaxID=1931237 RepID=UPI0032F082B7
MPSQSIKLKVCGLRDNVIEVTDVEPDFMGFIFYKKSPRFVGEDFVMPNGIRAKKVGVFVNQSIEEVMSLKQKYQLDYLQLHGDESVDYCVELKAVDSKIIKVFAGNKPLNQEVLDSYSEFIDYYLFDTKMDKHGGNGIAFDWTNIDQLRLKKPYILSGGISLDNVVEVSRSVNIPFAVDVNSKFEISPGLKDIKRLKELTVTLSQSK